MTIWSAEIKDLEKLHDSFKGKHPRLDMELDKLVKTDDDNIVLVYARRCLEVIITDLSERELKRPRGTEPLKGIIDKLNREEKVPHNIIVSMQNLNSLSSFGAHPKDFDPRQVKPVILDLTTVIEWYFSYAEKTGDSSQTAKSPSESDKRAAIQKRNSGKKRTTVVIASSIVLVVAVIVSLILIKVIGSNQNKMQEPIKSIAILPFENYTGNEVPEYLIAGLHSSLITNMGKVGNLRIIGSTSSNKYKNVDMTVSEIASELNVDAIIEGDLISTGDSINIILRLINAGQEEKQLWIGDYKREISQILNLYNQITLQIAEEVKVSLTPEEENLLTGSRSIDKEAYDAYLKGLQYWDRLGIEDLQMAMNYFETAIEIEPDWAPPYAGIAQTAQGLAQMGGMLPGEAMPIIFKNRSKAVELDPDYPGSHYTNAISAAWVEWDWDTAEKEFKKALDLNPNDVKSRIYYAHLLAILGRFDEAHSQSQKAVAIEPYDPLVLALAAVGDIPMGYTQEAVDKLEKALELDPGHPFAFMQSEEAYYFNGNYLKAIENLWTMLTNYVHIRPLENIMEEYQNNGYSSALRLLLSDVEKSLQEGAFFPPAYLGIIFLRIPDTKKALDYFEQGYEIHDQNEPYISVYGHLYPELQKEPRYIALLKKMNLPVDEN